EGYGAVNLFELAKSMGMSRGNMTYHFKDKETLLNALAEELWEKLEDINHSQQIPSFKNLHHDAQLYYQLQRAYSFIFQDQQVLKHPCVAPTMKHLAEKTIRDIEVAIAFSIEVGNMKPEAVAGTYKHLALTSWILMFFWSPQQKVRGETSSQDGEKVIWSLLFPHLTPKGLTAFQKYFGESYLKDIGPPFDVSLDTILTF
ncbi:MAG: TetR/AcrR family transcriptional regulator, partial [Bacteroidota bacterium]